MVWNWERKEWPNFIFDATELQKKEESFLKGTGIIIGLYTHINEEEKINFRINLISEEALKTSEIEGEFLNRDSVVSSVRRNFGLDTNNMRVSPAEKGISDMMVDLYNNFSNDLSHETLFRWHNMLSFSRYEIQTVGNYRNHPEPMQIVSGPFHNPKVFFEAPPSRRIPQEMEKFISWFNRSSPNQSTNLPYLIRAGIAHLYFVCIHPFEDGNGRIARAIAEKALAQGLAQPSLIALATTIQKNKKDYYASLENNNQSLDITNWLLYFAQTILDAQSYSQQLLNFIISKTKFYDRFRSQLNERQLKVVSKMFQAGFEGFIGGMSAEKYISITGTSRPTATRDLTHLVNLGACLKSGSLKSTRYSLNV